MLQPLYLGWLNPHEKIINQPGVDRSHRSISDIARMISHDHHHRDPTTRYRNKKYHVIYHYDLNIYLYIYIDKP